MCLFVYGEFFSRCSLTAARPGSGVELTPPFPRTCFLSQADHPPSSSLLSFFIDPTTSHRFKMASSLGGGLGGTDVGRLPPDDRLSPRPRHGLS